MHNDFWPGPRDSPFAPRKAPTQARARETVEAILEAARRELLRVGFARITTNQVAQVAGVSVGSLYQYFADKESLVAQLLVRQRIGLRDRLRRAVRRLGGLGFDQLVELWIEVYREDGPMLNRALPVVVSLGLEPILADIDHQIVALLGSNAESDSLADALDTFFTLEHHAHALLACQAAA